MGSKSRNTNYDILDKILADSDRATRGSGRSGKHQTDEDGTYILTPEELAELDKSVDDIEKYLRS